MVEIYIDHRTNRIIGYNKIVDESTDITDPDRIFVDIEDLHLISEMFIPNGLYYIDGNVVQKENSPDHMEDERQELYKKYDDMKKKIDNEQHIFMDNIIDGMSLEEATAISKKNREEFAKLSNKIEKMESDIKKETENKICEKFEKEEQKIEYKYFLSMITIVRDENDYIEEWIRYHIEDIGFDHFYIYDNESSIPVKEYLESVNFKYMDKITFLDWKTSENSQHDSHMDFLNNYAKETKWFFTSDPDEYVVIKEDGKTLKEFLEENSQYSAIECIWHHFNANGQERKTDGTDMERFTTEVDWWYGKDHGKRFAQSNRVRGFSNYNAETRLNTTIAGKEVESVENFFQLNHYYTRSYEEWLKKISRGTVVPYARRKYSEFFELNPDMKYLDTGTDYAQPYGSPSEINN